MRWCTLRRSGGKQSRRWRIPAALCWDSRCPAGRCGSHFFSLPVVPFQKPQVFLRNTGFPQWHDSATAQVRKRAMTGWLGTRRDQVLVRVGWKSSRAGCLCQPADSLRLTPSTLSGCQTCVEAAPMRLRRGPLRRFLSVMLEAAATLTQQIARLYAAVATSPSVRLT